MNFTVLKEISALPALQLQVVLGVAVCRVCELCQGGLFPARPHWDIVLLRQLPGFPILAFNL